MNEIPRLSSPTFTQPRAAVGGAAPESAGDQISLGENREVQGRPTFENGATEGQRRSFGWGRAAGIFFALTIALAGAGCATMQHGSQETTVGRELGRSVRQTGDAAKEFGREWHEKVDKPVAEKAKGVWEWFREQGREFREGVRGK